MFTAPDGSKWHQGVRWFYEGAYHLKLPENKPRRYGSHYHVFMLASDHTVKRIYEMQPGDQVRCKLPELARRFANSHYTARETFDPKKHGEDTGRPGG